MWSSMTTEGQDKAAKIKIMNTDTIKEKKLGLEIHTAHILKHLDFNKNYIFHL